MPLLAARIQQNPEMTVIINCDKAQRIARFEKVFDLIKQSNARNVMIATSPKTSIAAATE
jgi:biopolymer transport protein ExbD